MEEKQNILIRIIASQADFFIAISSKQSLNFQSSANERARFRNFLSEVIIE